MRAVVYPSRIGVDGKPAHYNPPPSKSHFQRVCAAALLRGGFTVINNPGRAQDDNAALNIARSLGVRVMKQGGVLALDTPQFGSKDGIIHCGESGLAARLFPPIAALLETAVTVTGEGSLKQRPMQPLVSALEMLDVRVTGFKGTIPFTVQGPLRAKNLTVDGSLSSQIISGLLFAMAKAATQPVKLVARGLVSIPYLQMSCAVLEDFGMPIDFDGFETCYIDPANFNPPPIVSVLIQPDWSSIAPITVAAAFTGEVVMDAHPSPHQADSTILTILRKAGASVHLDETSRLCNIGPAPLHAFETDCTHSPDLAPILTILACTCEGHSRISGIRRLAHKESDRTKTTSALLTALSIDHRIEGDAFVITGPQTPRSATVSSHNDHRIVMAAAIAALRADGPVTIEGAEAVRKSYPDFFQDLQKLGVQAELTQ